MKKQFKTSEGAFRTYPSDIFITDIDMERLEEVVSTAERSDTLTMLEEELARAIVVPCQNIARDVVTMNSQVRFKDLSTQGEFDMILCYPSASGLEDGRVSVLAPVGAALLGMKVGDEIEWPLPSGRKRSLKVTAVPFQPEATGQFHL